MYQPKHATLHYLSIKKMGAKAPVKHTAPSRLGLFTCGGKFFAWKCLRYPARASFLISSECVQLRV